MKPPSVYDVTMPSSHMMKRTTNMVQSIASLPRMWLHVVGQKGPEPQEAQKAQDSVNLVLFVLLVVPGLFS